MKNPTILPADVVCVRYYRPDLAEKAISAVEGSGFVHVICALGAFAIVEANTAGVRWTDLRDYMLRRDCDLLLLRPKRRGSYAKTVRFWKSCVKKDDSYSFLGDARLGLILLARHIGLGSLASRLGDKELKRSGQKFCSQVAIQGLVKGGFYQEIDSFNVAPSDVAIDDTNFRRIAMWVGRHGHWFYDKGN